MPFSIQCPQCGKRLTAKNDKVIGKKLPCPKCKHVFLVEATPPESNPESVRSGEPDLAANDPLGIGGLETGGNATDDNGFASDDFADMDFDQVGTANLPAVPLPQPKPSVAAPAARKKKAGGGRKDGGMQGFLEANKMPLMIGCGSTAGVLLVVSLAAALFMAFSSGSGGSDPPAVLSMAETNTDPDGAVESESLKKRLHERFVTTLKTEHASASDAELSQLADAAVEKEIALNRKVFDQFLIITAKDEQLLQSGKRLVNSTRRALHLRNLLREFEAEYATPPGILESRITVQLHRLDAELCAHYLEVGLIRLMTGLGDADDPQQKAVVAETIRILRQEDLASIDLDKLFELANTNVAQSKTPGIAGADAKGTVAKGAGASGGTSRDVRMASNNNLKRIAVACHNYHDTYKCFPAAVQIGPKGTPHSWRVTILPFLGNELASVYARYRQDEPWDSPHNNTLLKEMPEVYRAPDSPAGSTETCYFGFSSVGDPGEPTERNLHPALFGHQTTRFRDIRDGTSNTILVVESKLDAPWTKPEDIPFDPESPLPVIGGIQDGGFNAVLCDGSTRFFPDGFDKQMLKHALTIGDGNTIEWPRRE